MRKSTPRIIKVWADWTPNHKPALMGELAVTPSRGKEIFSFQYAPDWLASGQAQILDPALQLFQGPQYSPTGQQNFGVFLDSCPDRWGRVLMRRREALNARTTGRTERRLVESDYLLGVHDGHRMGGLRFTNEQGEPFLDNSPDNASPPWTSLRELEQVSLKLENKDASEDPNYATWLRMLVAPGSSLGGARPKASVVDHDGALWIAKFASRRDDGVGSRSTRSGNSRRPANGYRPNAYLRHRASYLPIQAL